VELQRAYWRLGPHSEDIKECLNDTKTGWSPCRGGNDFARSYCEEGHKGPLCQVCSNSSFYFMPEEKKCVECPNAGNKIGLIIGIIAGVILGLAALWGTVERCKESIAFVGTMYRQVMLAVHHAHAKSTSLSLIPKLKLLLAFYQSVVVLPTVYNVHLPDYYYDNLRFLNLFQIDWSGVTVPGACLEGGYFARLMLRGLGPLVLLLMCVVIAFAATLVMHFARKANLHHGHLHEGFEELEVKRSVLSKALISTMPVLLLICFCLTAPTASAIFTSWSCIEFAEDSISDFKRAYLRADLRVECFTYDGDSYTYNDEYMEILNLAIVFMVIWALLMPLFFLATLLPSRKDIMRKRSTPLTRATLFLHREYEPAFFFWEPLFLLQRLVLVGFVQFIDRAYYYARLLVGLLVCIVYMVMLLSTKPYKRDDVDRMSAALQFVLVLLFFAAQSIYLFTTLSGLYDDGASSAVLGFGSLDELVVVMVVCNIFVLGCFAALLLYEAATTTVTRTLRLVTNGQPPELELAPKIRYHLFVSHIWSSGQDQAAVIKRQMSLMLPGLVTFLDVDDLEDISLLEKYVEFTQCMLVLLTKGYFYSRNCLRELNSIFTLRKPFLSVHEADSGRGGGPLSVMRADAEASRSEVAPALFSETALIVTWHRVSEYQLLSLKIIAEKVVHTMPSYIQLKQPPGLFIADELLRQTYVFRTPVIVYVSRSNPGAAAMADELLQKYEEGMFMTEKRPEVMASPPSDVIVTPQSVVVETRPFSEDAGIPTHMLLYLNKHTFVGPEGQVLAHEVRQAREHKLPIVMVHETDEFNDGCEFENFFRSTPEDLVSDGLYSAIATALHREPHRQVSFVLISKVFGSTRVRNATHHKMLKVNEQLSDGTVQLARKLSSMGTINLSKFMEPTAASDPEFEMPAVPIVPTDEVQQQQQQQQVHRA
jgi:hypothetical protein